MATTMASATPAKLPHATPNGRHRDPQPAPTQMRSRAGVGAANVVPTASISAMVSRKGPSPNPNPNPRSTSQQGRPVQRRYGQRPVVITDDESDLDGFDSSGEDDFFTPNQSPRTSMASSSIAFPSKASSRSAVQPRRASRRSLHTPTPTQITPTNSTNGSLPPPTISIIPPKQPPPLNGSSASASALLQQQNQRVASVNRKVSNPITSSGIYSHQRRASASNSTSTPTQKPSIPLNSPTDAGKPSSSSLSRTHTRIHSVPASKASPTLTPNSSTSLSRSSSLNQRPAPPPPTTPTTVHKPAVPRSTERSGKPQPPFLRHPDSQPNPNPHPNPTRITSTTSSALSLSSTSLENHSDIFSGSSVFTDSPMTTPFNSDPGKVNGGVKVVKVAAKPKSKASSTSRSTRLPASYHTMNGSIVQPQPRRGSGPHQHQQQVPQTLPQKDYSYTEDDWAKDVRWLAGSIVTGSSESVNGIAHGNEKAILSRNGSYASKKDKEDRLALGLGLPLNIGGKGKEKEKEKDREKGKGKEVISEAVAEVKGKGKEAEQEQGGGGDEKDGKKKRRKGKTTGREVVYYTATNGTPMLPSLVPDSPSQTNGSAIGASTSHPISIPSYKLGALIEEEDEDRRLSVVLEGEEDVPTTPVLSNGNALRNSTATKNSNARLEPIKRRRSRSVGDSNFEDSMVVVEVSDAQYDGQPRQTSVLSWADDYKSILARTRAQAENGGSSGRTSTGGSGHRPNVMTSTLPPSTTHSHANSQSSFAYSNALPVGTGELPSNGTPGYTALHLPRAPPGVFPREKSKLSGLSLRGILAPSTLHHPEPTVSMNPRTLDGKVDLTRSGVAQTTMTSVEVVRGLGVVVGSTGGIGSTLPPNKKGFKGIFSSRGRRRTVSGGEAEDILERQKKGILARGLSFSGRIRKGSEDVYAYASRAGKASLLPALAAEDPVAQAMATISAERVLGFAGYRKPPTYVPSGGVLVQVWAVGVDGVDGKLVGLRLGTAKPKAEDTILDGEALVDEPEDEYDRGRATETEGEETEREDRGRRRKHSTGLGSLRERLGSLSRRKHSLSLKSKWKRDNDHDILTDEEVDPKTPYKKKSKDRAKRKDSKEKDKALPPPPIVQPEVGFIPGRSFVGRVLECGWEVKEEVVRKGEWVVGMLDPKKSGGLTQFIVVDRHRICKVPYPSSVTGEAGTTTTTSFNSLSTNSTTKPPTRMQPAPSPTMDELALLPLCGLPAYRAVRTLMRAFSGLSQPPTSPRALDYPSFASAMNNGTFLGGRHHLYADHEPNRKRRALVLRGHDGVGAMAVQMLALRGWRVSVHVPVPGPHDSDGMEQYMAETEGRVLHLGGEEVVFDDGGSPNDPWWDEGRTSAVRVIDWLKEDGDVYDAVIDTIGGKEIREASERLLKSMGREEERSDDGTSPPGRGLRKGGPGQFTTLVGDVPERTIPTAADNFRAGLRSLKFGTGAGGGSGDGDSSGFTSPTEETRGKVGYAWISVTQDVDWEGEDVAETIGNVLRLTLEHGIKPIVPRVSAASESSAMYGWKNGVVTFERAPEIFVNGDGPLCNGGTMVVKIAE